MAFGELGLGAACGVDLVGGLEVGGLEVGGFVFADVD